MTFSFGQLFFLVGSSFWYFKFNFSVFFEKVIWYHMSSFSINVLRPWNYKTFPNRKKKRFVYQFSRRLLGVCNHMIDIIVWMVVCGLKISCKSSLFKTVRYYWINRLNIEFNSISRPLNVPNFTVLTTSYNKPKYLGPA